MEEMAPSGFASALKGYGFLCTEYTLLRTVLSTSTTPATRLIIVVRGKGTDLYN